ncbi:hypothetical protein [Sphingobium cloacae]|uniref:hypothetical protein n=1 Tax=Sphingobium cloacae TaxID=120107 RepID=UPI000833B8E4|nr:hypothetical protein [Sphingobium cloacae]
MGFRKTVKGDDATELAPGNPTPDNPETGAVPAVPETDPPAIPAPTVATDKDGHERPLSGGSFIRVNGKLVRKEA